MGWKYGGPCQNEFWIYSNLEESPIHSCDSWIGERSRALRPRSERYFQRFLRAHGHTIWRATLGVSPSTLNEHVYVCMHGKNLADRANRSGTETGNPNWSGGQKDLWKIPNESKLHRETQDTIQNRPMDSKPYLMKNVKRSRYLDILHNICIKPHGGIG